MALRTTFNFAVKTQLPNAVEEASVVTLVQDHDAYMTHDKHILEQRSLGSQTVRGHGRVNSFDGVSEWLRSEVERYLTAKNTASQGEDGAQQAWNIQFWELSVDHPVGFLTGKLMYTAGFINIPSGVFVIVDVPGALGMHSWTIFKIVKERRGSIDVLYLAEEGNVDCVWGLGSFIKRKILTTHKLAHQKIISELEKT